MDVSKPNLPDFTARRPISDLAYVYEELKQSCMIGEFEPGQKLTLPLLAEAFGTSQMPIREATNRLIAARAMEAPPRKSLCIPQASVERLDSLLPLRVLLECEATRIAVEKSDSSLASELLQINGEMEKCDKQDDLKGYLRMNQNFHFTLYRACQNDDMIDMIELLWMRYGPLMNIVRSGDLSRTGHAKHIAVINAAKISDGEGAAEAIAADIRDAAKAIREKILSTRARK